MNDNDDEDDNNNETQSFSFLSKLSSDASQNVCPTFQSIQ